MPSQARIRVLKEHLCASVNDDGAGQGQGPSGTIVVVGSCFMDYVAYVDRMPKRGETLHSSSFAKGFGGKGANQAFMAALVGAPVKMASAVGADGDGAAYVANLKAAGVNTDHIVAVPRAHTGLAMIAVEKQGGANQIVICPNATEAFTAAGAARKALDWPKVLGTYRADANLPSVQSEGPSAALPTILICQNEIPLATTLAAIKVAHGAGIYTILNAAPAPSPAEVRAIIPYLRHVSLLCPNEKEASLLTGINVTEDTATAAAACAALHDLGVGDVVLTLGESGFMISTRQMRDIGTPPKHYSAWTPGSESTAAQLELLRDNAGAPSCARAENPAFDQPVADTTGAGDCFLGAMAAYLLRGWTLEGACAAANYCAGISVRRKGTQSSYPRREELPQLLQ